MAAWNPDPEVFEVTVDEAREAVRTLLRYIGEDPDREGLLETPDRILRAYGELLCGYKQDPVAILQKSFGLGPYDQMIVVKAIPFVSWCEHHWMAFVGVAHVAYIPCVVDGKGARVVGLSKVARVVDVYAKRLQIQERMTLQIANALETVLAPEGVAVVIEATHQCMSSRGALKRGAGMVTSEMRGIFRDDPRARAEFFMHIKEGA